MINFLNSKLTPKVVCQSPAMDGYEVDNLISENFSDRNRGFIAYSAIKPPVEIEFEFICPINIHFIKLDTVVGSQKCSGIEMYAKSRSSSYTSICRSVFNKAGVYFCNSRKYSKVTPPDGFNENNELAFFKSNTFKCFLDAASIKVVIFRTEKSVPCLGSVEVWGTVSKSCSAVTTNTIKRLVSKAEMPKFNSESTELDEFKIPEDFKDELTYEIMTVPMTLPSGKTVDQSTLEKHIQSEISFSRKPCDPFTGIKFTDKLKPLVNLALKSRIDMFVLQNSQRPEFANMGRTLGRISSSNGRQRDMENDTNKRKRDRSENSLDEAISKVKQNPNFVSFTSELEENCGNKCAKCKNIESTVYKIPCQHLYCRKCLLLICEYLKCSICDGTFLKSEVEKCNP